MLLSLKISPSGANHTGDASLGTTPASLLARAFAFLSKAKSLCYLGHGVESYSLMLVADVAFVTVRLGLRKDAGDLG